MRRGIRLKGIKVVTKPNGDRYVYRRVKGALIRLPDLPENDERFLAAYAAAGKAQPKPKSLFAKGTIGALVEEFKRSPQMKTRAESTQIVWNRRLEHIRSEYGVGKVADLRTDHIQKALKKLTPGAARSERTIWRALLEFAVEEGWRTDNPAMLIRNRKYKAEPHIAWSSEDIEAFRKHWPAKSPQRQAFEVIFWTGARCSDAINLGWQGVTDGVLIYTQKKTEAPAYVPITATVDEALKADQKVFLDNVSEDLIWILNRWGKPRSVKALSQFVSAAAKDAKLENRTAHGLRKSRATILAELGWTPHRIAAWTGHESLTEIEHYTRSADRKKLVTGTEQDRNSGNRKQVVSINSKKSN